MRRLTNKDRPPDGPYNPKYGVVYPNGLGELIEPGEIMDHLTWWEATAQANQWSYFGTYAVVFE